MNNLFQTCSICIVILIISNGPATKAFKSQQHRDLLTSDNFDETQQPINRLSLPSREEGQQPEQHRLRTRNKRRISDDVLSLAEEGFLTSVDAHIDGVDDFDGPVAGDGRKGAEVRTRSKRNADLTSARQQDDSNEVITSAGTSHGKSQKLSKPAMKKSPSEPKSPSDVVNDGWGPWAPWGPCSMSCGGGVKVQARKCSVGGQNRPSHRKRRHKKSFKARRVLEDSSTDPSAALNNLCLGISKRFQLCNDVDCPAFQPYQDPMEQECSRFNNKTYGGTVFQQWEPFEKGDSPCQVTCRPSGQNFVMTLSKAATDGLVCSPPQTSSQRNSRSKKNSPLTAPFDDKYVDEAFVNKGRHVCISGKCTPVSCEGVIGKKWTPCPPKNPLMMVSGLFTRHDLHAGAHVITTIPQGAKFVNVSHLQPSANRLGFRLTTNGLMLAGGSRHTWRPHGQNLEFARMAGMQFTFGGIDNPREERGWAALSGPLTEPVEIILIMTEWNQGIAYRYFEPERPISNEPNIRTSAGYHPLTTQRTNDANRRSQNNRRINPAGQSNRNQWNDDMFADTPNAGRIDGVPSSRERELDVDSNQNKAQVRRMASRSMYTIRRPNKNRQKFTNEVTSRTQTWGDEFSITSNGGQPGRFSWTPMGHGACSASCGGGHMPVALRCIDIATDRVIPDDYCRDTPKPASTVDKIPCNNDVPCPPRWTLSEWGDCSAPCGPGVQERRWECRRQLTSILTMVQPDEDCSGTSGQKPQSQRRTCQRQPCAVWMTGPWSVCSMSCGTGGIKRREVSCGIAASVTHNETSLMPTVCNDHEKPSNTEPCHGPPCSMYRIQMPETTREDSRSTTAAITVNEADFTTKSNRSDLMGWFVSDWDDFECSQGFACTRNSAAFPSRDANRRRQVFCPNEDCQELDRPKEEELCEPKSSLGEAGCSSIPSTTPEVYFWVTGPWDTCTANCGLGTRHRRVFCVNATETSEGSNWQFFSVSDAWCNQQDQPIQQEQCNQQPCGPKWVTGPWSQCSVTCGAGQRRRSVICWNNSSNSTEFDHQAGTYYNRNRYQRGDQCDSLKKPAEEEPCLSQSCTSGTQVDDTGQTIHQSTTLAEGGNVALSDSAAVGSSISSNAVSSAVLTAEIFSSKSSRSSSTEKTTSTTTTTPLSTSTARTSTQMLTTTRSPKSHSKDDQDLCVDTYPAKKCHLVYQARFCALELYRSRCCATCSSYKS